jgi:hypothetical protein
MFKVVINLDMTKTHYEQITNDYSALTTASRHLQLLKTTLEISSTEPKISSALRDSDENTIAEQIEALYCNEMSLSRTNLERRPTMPMSNISAIFRTRTSSTPYNIIIN